MYRNYKNIKGWIKYDYNRVVKPSDEAFVWQVMTFYYPVWLATVADQPNSAGPRAGFNQTTGKTTDTYYKYLQDVGSSRVSENSKLWSAKLKQVARDREQQNTATRISDAMRTRVRTIADEQDTRSIMQYARLNAGGLSDEESDFEDATTDDSTDSSAGVPPVAV